MLQDQRGEPLGLAFGDPVVDALEDDEAVWRLDVLLGQLGARAAERRVLGAPDEERRDLDRAEALQIGGARRLVVLEAGADRVGWGDVAGALGDVERRGAPRRGAGPVAPPRPLFRDP